MALFVALIAMSFSILEVDEYGLDYSWISQSVSNTSYNSGWHFLGVGHHFVRFPKVVQTIEFSKTDKEADWPSLTSRTNDGLEVTLEVSFQYMLQAEKIYDLYMNFGESYKNVFIREAIEVITTAATNYSAYGFFMNRTIIGTDMQMYLTKALNSSYYASVEFFQLRSVDLPPEFDKAIADTEVAKQNITKASAQFNASLVNMQTELYQAQYAANVTINLAKGQAEATVISANASAQSFELVQEAQAKAYKQIKDDLNMDSEDFIDYLKARAIRDHAQDAMVVSLEKNRTESSQ